MESYRRLLDATLRHLESLRERGVLQVRVDRELLRSLREGPGRVPLSAAGISARVTAAEPARAVAGPVGGRPVSAGVVVPNPAGGRAAVASGSPAGGPLERAAAAASGALPPKLGRIEKEGAMVVLRQRAEACVRCPHLVRDRANVVFGVGDVHAALMFVGEAPGADEDRQGEPFVGKAGQLLTRILQAMELSRESVYIANILKCRPDTPGQASGNRKPTLEEMAVCAPYLVEQIDLIQPRVLVALGTTAIEGLLGLGDVRITKLRGNWQSFRGIPLMPTYHPAYVLRNQALSVKREIWEDMLAVMERLGMPVSPRQRGFFLSK